MKSLMVMFSSHRSSRLRAQRFTALLCIICMAGCAHWPVIETPPPYSDSPLALDAPEPETVGEATIQETAQPEEVAIAADATETDLGSPGPFPRPGSGIASSSPASTQHRHELPVVTEAAESVPNWVEAGRSYEGREIEAIQFGNVDPGNQSQLRVLFVSSMSAGDLESVRFIDRLATRLSRIEFSDDVAALLIRSPNPDGLAGHFSTNSRGVELNRNFPSPRFPVTRTTRTGAEPASEIETQAIIQLLVRFQPTRIVHVRPGSGDTLLILCEDNVHRAVSGRVDGLPVNVACHDGDFKAGSIEEYCRDQWESDIVTVYLPGSLETTDADELLRGVSLACLNTELPQVEDDASNLATQSASSSETIEPHGERGFVESLPPPDEHSDRPQDSRYYELPPPPE